MKLTTFKVGDKTCVAFVRKLTERECGRLMGVDDEDITTIKESGVSKSNQYKMYGNSIVVDVLYHIFRKAFVEKGNDSQQMSIFDMMADQGEMEYTKEHPLRVFTLCSGYDSQCLALERLKKDYPEFDYELVGWAEFDPESNQEVDKQPAVIAHKQLFPQWADLNYGDMTKIDWEKTPDFDLLFYSTPCQSISQAGLQHGFVEGSGTRSSIIWNVRDALKIKKPKYACLENVAAMVSQKFLPMFKLWDQEVHRLGYMNFSKLLNAKNYGIPQNRERIFMFSIYNPSESVHYNWPEPMKLTKKLLDILEEDVDTAYYLNPVRVDEFVKDNLKMILEYANSDEGVIEPLPDYLREWIESIPDPEKSEEEASETVAEEEEIEWEDDL